MFGAPTTDFEIGYPPPAGLEIADGIGLSLDGGGLVIGDSASQGTWTITGPDGKTDAVVQRNGNDTEVTTPFHYADVQLHRNDNKEVHITTRLSPEPSVVRESGTEAHLVWSSFRAERYDANIGDNRVVVHHNNVDTVIQYDADRISVRHENGTNTSWTRTANGFHVEGQGAVDVTYTADGFVVNGGQGRTQRWEVHRTAAPKSE